MKSKLLACLLLLASPLVPALMAQDAEVSMKLYLVAWGDKIGGLSLKSAKKSGGVTALPFQYSDPVPYSGPALMEVHKNGEGEADPVPQPSKEDLEHQLVPLEPAPQSKADPAAPGDKLAAELAKRREKDPGLVALVQLPAGARMATILLAPTSEGTYFGYVIHDDPAKLPLGQVLIHNLSPNTLAMQCNKLKPKTVKQRGTLTVPAADGALSYDLVYQQGGEWKFQEHNIIPVKADEQTHMIILRSDHSYFRSADGSTGGYLQTVILRRKP